MSPGEVANNVFPALPLTMQPGEPAAGVLPTPTQALTMQPGDPGDDIFLTPSQAPRILHPRQRTSDVWFLAGCATSQPAPANSRTLE